MTKPSVQNSTSVPQKSSQNSTLQSNQSKINKFRANGRLSNEEWKRRKENNLCMYCGEAGHIGSACPAREKQKTSDRGQFAQLRSATSSTASGTTSNQGSALQGNVQSQQ